MISFEVNKFNCPDESTPVDSSISKLASRDREIRKLASNFLISAGDEAVKPLISALSCSNSEIRWEAGKILDQSKFDWSKHSDQATLEMLIAYLGNEDGFVRQNSRNFLVKIGKASVPGLIQALSSSQAIQRWEAAEALNRIVDPSAIEALIKALDDNIFDIRWVAASSLISIGNQTIKPLLQLLINRPESVHLREGIHRVLYALNRDSPNEVLRPVIKILETSEAPLRVPWEAEKALKLL